VSRKTLFHPAYYPMDITAFSMRVKTAGELRSVLTFIKEPEEFSRHSDGQLDGRPGFDSRQRQEIFMYSTASRVTLRPAQSHNLWTPGALFSGGQQPRHGDNHSPPSSAL
jgi:hypothetical protein